MRIKKLFRFAFYLALFTILYNLVEGIISITLGYSDETLALFGFAYIDAIGAAGLIWFSVKEGMEAMEKAKKRSYAECRCHADSEKTI